ncbi:sensor histidine kinase [Parashewanella spongiae]|uniref:histidine kinase n=1 Tax=Parashewanella spongiae TaxID=342950 RepID=A0A3A6UMM2_9GAMM|nr:HAMP domain-containing sensor histidine kinase [Parashewanella spongiae]MCL1077382.1 HAMP domain-containing histidine kinase [Parashewanella spongiae]RJY18992.1 sensor histidine kinase [Parashewanella spongiae]
MQESKVTQSLIYPRYFGFLIRLLLTYWLSDWFGLSLDSQLLGYFFAVELIYLFISHHQLAKVYDFNDGLFWLLLIDNAFWLSWLYLTGGATNAFISSLLIPIAIAAIALPIWNSLLLSIINCLAYSVMLYLSSDNNHMAHMNMGAHYIGMWLNFILSAVVINASLTLISRKLRQRDSQLSQLRESQLKQEQLVALGATSAQMAHQLATPLCSMRLWLDEISEKYTHQGINEINANLIRCESSLKELRMATEAIREGNKQSWPVDRFIQDVKKKTQLLLPHHEITWTIPNDSKHLVSIDHGVLPALITLIDNAAKASFDFMTQAKVELAIELSPHHLVINIRDFGKGIDSNLSPYLGHKMVPSNNGLGIALLLTNATLERNLSTLSLAQHSEQGSIAIVHIPVNTK